jgi:hypothetical protein
MGHTAHRMHMGWIKIINLFPVPGTEWDKGTGHTEHRVHVGCIKKINLFPVLSEIKRAGHTAHRMHVGCIKKNKSISGTEWDKGTIHTTYRYRTHVGCIKKNLFPVPVLSEIRERVTINSTVRYRPVLHRIVDHSYTDTVPLPGTVHTAVFRTRQ